MALILNKPQAEAIASAMAALNNVNMKIKAEFGNPEGDYINCFETKNEMIKVNRVYHYRVMEREFYSSQAAFIAVYEAEYK